MADVFISYSRKNITFARRLFEALKEDGRDSWIDWDDIPVSARWWKSIQEGIAGANAVVVVITPDSLVSPVCTLEVAHAITCHKRIIPIVHIDANFEVAQAALAEIEPTGFLAEIVEGGDLVEIAQKNYSVLESINWIFFREGDDFDAGLVKLINAAEIDYDRVKQHTRLLVRAREWVDQGRDPSYLLYGADLREAASWLNISGDKDPRATTEHYAYIQASLDQAEADQDERQRQVQELNNAWKRARDEAAKATTQRRRARFAGVLALILVIVLFAASLFATSQIYNANSRIATATFAQGAALNDQGTALAQVSTATIAQGAAVNQERTAIARAASATRAQGAALNQAMTATIAQGAAVAQAATATFAQGAALNDRRTAVAQAATAQYAQATAVALLGESEVQRDILNLYSYVLDNLDDPNFDASGLMDDLATKYPDRAETYFYRAAIDRTQNRNAEAVIEYSRAIELAPTSEPAYSNRARAYFDLGEYDKALADLNQALELAPDDPADVSDRGSVYAALGDAERAIADYTRAIELNPNNANPYYGRAQVYTEQERYDEAIADYTTVVTLAPSYWSAYVNRAIIYIAHERYEEGIADLNQALKLNPDYEDALYLRGYTYLQQQRYEEAYADLTRALQLNPGDTEAANALAIVNTVFSRATQTAVQNAAATSLAP